MTQNLLRPLAGALVLALAAVSCQTPTSSSSNLACFAGRYSMRSGQRQAKISRALVGWFWKPRTMAGVVLGATTVMPRT